MKSTNSETRSDIGAVPGVAAIAPFVQLYALMTPHGRGAHGSLGIPCQVDGVDWAADAAIGRLDPRLLHPQPVEDLSAPPIPPQDRGSGLITPDWREQLCLLGAHPR